MLISDTATRGEREADAELPPEPATALCYGRLRTLCDGDLDAAARHVIRTELAGTIRQHIHGLTAALDALDGPDPEMGLIYMLDSIATTRRALTVLDARLTRSALALAASLLPLVS